MARILVSIAGKRGGDADTSRDYEYTDWDAMDEFAEAFAAEADTTPIAE